MAGHIYTFSTNVPQANQTISATQAPILSNFQAINELFNVNHVGFSDTTNFGKHTYTTLPVQSADVATSASEISVYAKAVTTANGVELFYRYPSNGSVFQLTGGGNGGVAAINGSASLNASLTMNWGLATINPTGSTVVTFPTGGGIIPFTMAVNIVNWCAASNYTLTANGGWISNITTTSFQFNAPSGGMCTTIYWYAMGF